jgi:hypothetical protein
MPWIETASPAFRARHDAADTADATRLLAALERTRSRLHAFFPRSEEEETTVVLHGSTASLMLARPAVALEWALTAPAARRYVAGYRARGEIHVLSARALHARASAVPGSREMLALTAPALYAHGLVVANNRELQARPRVARPALLARWAWLVEGAARWFGGQTEHARPAIARRLREGRPPAFPPGRRDAPLLGGTVIDLLAREAGVAAAARLACRLHPGGPRAALERAFDGRPLAHTEGAWRSHLARLAGAAERSVQAAQRPDDQRDERHGEQ